MLWYPERQTFVPTYPSGPVRIRLVCLENQVVANPGNYQRAKYFDYEHVCIWPRPLQQPHPPVVFPADSEEGLELAAGHRVPTGAAYRSTAKCLETFERYRAAAQRHGWTPQPHDHLLLRHIYVAESNERARAEAAEHLHYFWQYLMSYHQGIMRLLGQTLPQRPAVVRRAEDLPF